MLKKTPALMVLFVAVMVVGIGAGVSSALAEKDSTTAPGLEGSGLNTLVQQLMDARANYGEGLHRLADHYKTTGNSQGRSQAKRELDEFRDIRQRQYLLDTRARLIVVDMDACGESDIVESLVEYRMAYRKSLDSLIAVFKGAKDDKNWTQAKRELKDLIAVNKYLYLRDADTPGVQLRPTKQIAAADELYEEAMQLKKKSKPWFVRRYETQLAIGAFRRLIAEYPDSDKIDDAAYQIGELCRDNLKDYQRAIRWYECVLAWNSQTQLEANLRIAQVYDKHLVNRLTALDYYQRALKTAARGSSERKKIEKRINQLRGK